MLQVLDSVRIVPVEKGVTFKTRFEYESDKIITQRNIT